MENCLLCICVSVFGLKKSQPKHKNTTSPPWWSCFSLQRHGFYGRTYHPPGSLFARGWTRPPSKGFSRINKIQEKIIYFYSLSVNYNNRSPAAGNDSQNGINCRRRAAIIYELTNNILKNNSVARLYVKLTRIMLFSCDYARQIINNRKKNQLLRWPFRWPCGSGSMMPSTSSSKAGLGIP